MNTIENMDNKKEVSNIKPRLMGVSELARYLSLGTQKATELGKEAKACKRCGKRILFDVAIIDRYIDNMPIDEA